METSSELGNRLWQRHNCGIEGKFTSDGFDSRAFMVDASRGGFKLRFEMIDGAMAALMPLPCDLLVTNSDNATFPASVLWAKDGLAGCRFYQHLSLDDVVTLMKGRGFTIKVAKPSA